MSGSLARNITARMSGLGFPPPLIRKRKMDLYEEYRDKNQKIEESVEELENQEPNFWWNPGKILSYNCLFNFVVGNRGGGKTFGCKEWFIRKAIKTGEQFVYMRRTDKDITRVKKKFFNDLIAENKFPQYLFRIDGDEIQYIKELDGEPDPDEEWQVIGYFVHLSGGMTEKSIPYPLVKYIFFDEFIIPYAGLNTYLPDEVTTFLERYETIARMRDVVCLFLSNALTTINPYFLYFDIHLAPGKMIGRVKPDIAMELVANKDFIEAKKATRFGKLISGTEYGQYAIENKFVWEVTDDIMKIPEDAFYWMTLQWKDKQYGLFMSHEKQMVIVSKSVDKYQRGLINVTLKNGKLNKMMLTNNQKYYYLNQMHKLFLQGMIGYESKKIKGELAEMFRKIM